MRLHVYIGRITKSKNHFCVVVHIRIRMAGGWPSHTLAYDAHLRAYTRKGLLSVWYCRDGIRITHPHLRICARLWSHTGVCGEICAFMHVYTHTHLLALHTVTPTHTSRMYAHHMHITRGKKWFAKVIRFIGCSLFVHSTDGPSITRLLFPTHNAHEKVLTLFRQSANLNPLKRQSWQKL